ncbi:hypothetical protein LQ327_02885 [Actinomycetospora endophytica]|uniref:Uncharacterized protein n=1 Tax=Actinomycetospora endophytica TaxID=2291215 RepID=A0ABS8P257_9PSEU|nr:hypothetical protein [Actinomycetospora endophytica]MCD2192342.1 hypothetical protein [Actinomycetospora endophytica]
MNTTDVSPGTAPMSTEGLLRVGLHLLLAALPLLAISAHVFGLITMNWSAALLVVPLATAIVALTIFAPHPEERVILHGFLWGMLACALYDVFRLDTVYMLGWWADFIPTMGTWIIGDGASKTAGAWVGYLWRYLGDGGGIGVTFFVGAAFIGLHHRPPKQVVGASVAFAVFPVWAGLIATVWLAPRGQSLMFPLTPTTITLSLIGHLIFGLIMGLGFVKTRSAERFWPWAPVIGGMAPASHTVYFPADSRPALPPAGHPQPVGWPAATSGPVPVAATAQVAATAHRVAPPTTGERPVVVPPPPPLPAGHPSGPLPASTSSGPMPRQERPAAGHPSGPMPRQEQPVGGHPSGPLPAAGHPSGPLPAAARTGSQPVAARTGSQPAAARVGSGSSESESSGGPDTGRTRTATPPAGQTLDPETWALWQRQLATTIKGRRTHRWR